MRVATLRFFRFLLLLTPFCAAPAHAQTLQPVISEYVDHGSGSFVVTNSAFTPMAVLLEPRSFSIDADGKGEYRPLDPKIHIQLSSTSLRLGPRESRTVFYTVQAEDTPAWLTVYATFSPAHAGSGLTVRVMLPHTIYVYSKQALAREAVRVDRVEYDPELHKIVCELTNVGHEAGRAEEVEASGDHLHVSEAGFPLLPGGTRRLTIHWAEPTPPNLVTVSFPRFTLKLPVATVSATDR